MNEVGSAEISREGGLQLEFVWLLGAIASARRMTAETYDASAKFTKRAFVTLYWDKMGR